MGEREEGMKVSVNVEEEKPNVLSNTNPKITIPLVLFSLFQE